MTEETKVAQLVATRPESEIAADLKARIEAALVPVCALMDEAISRGLVVQWDHIGPTPPLMKCRVNGLRLVKHY